FLSERNIDGARAALEGFQRRLKAESADNILDTKLFGQPAVTNDEPLEFDDDADVPAISDSGAAAAASDNQVPTPVDVYRAPLLNFCTLLILTVERDARDLFTRLRNRYRADLREDESYDKIMDRIGQMYFGIQPPQAGGGQANFMQQMLQNMLMGGGGGGRGSIGA
ncbi:hypothetical protein THASP1DRAFT_26370, partial [Thamnocephalis sphaerospora]